MTTNFPSSIDAFTNPTSADTLDNPPHDQQHADINDAMEAVQAKVGVDGSAVTSSLDYKVAQQGLTLVKTQTIGSGVSSVTVTGAFSATFDNYRVICAGGLGSTAGELQLQMGSTTTGYYSQLVFTTWVSPWTPAGTGSSNVANFRQAGSNDPDGSLINIDVFNPYLARRTIISGGFVAPDTGRAGGFMNGALFNTTSYTGFTVLTNVGTITGGTIRVYGYNNG